MPERGGKRKDDKRAPAGAHPATRPGGVKRPSPGGRFEAGAARAGGGGRPRAEGARGGKPPAKSDARPAGGKSGGPKMVPGPAGSALRVVLQRGKSKPFWVGHPWLFSGAIEKVEGPVGETGGPCTVEDERGNPLGWGYYNPIGQIAVRIYWHRRTTDLPFEVPAFGALLRERIAAAVRLRQGIGFPSADTNVYRVINAEGDLLPGLIVDRLGDVLSVQLNARAMVANRADVLAALAETIGVSNFVVAVTETASKLEGLEAGQQLVGAPNFVNAPEGRQPTLVRERGLTYTVDLHALQKTGFYADQRENRQRFAATTPGRTVLDGYCHLGGFGLAAARAGARHVTQIDTSEPVIALARANAIANGLAGKTEALVEDVVVYLKEAQAAGRTWERVVIDPPKFAQSRAHLDDALQKYARLNALAIGAVAPGGLLLSCSCSRHVSEEDFGRMLTDAGHRLRRPVQILEQWGQPADHPSLSVAPEGRYLKAWLIAVG